VEEKPADDPMVRPAGRGLRRDTALFGCYAPPRIELFAHEFLTYRVPGLGPVKVRSRGNAWWFDLLIKALRLPATLSFGSGSI
jgi:hypothetical protein